MHLIIGEAMLSKPNVNYVSHEAVACFQNCLCLNFTLIFYQNAIGNGNGNIALDIPAGGSSYSLFPDGVGFGMLVFCGGRKT